MPRYSFSAGFIIIMLTLLGCAAFERGDPRIQAIVIEPESGSGEFSVVVHYNEGREPGNLVCEYATGEDAQTGRLSLPTEEGEIEDILVFSFEFNLTKPGRYLVSCRIDPFPDSGNASRFDVVAPAPEEEEEEGSEDSESQTRTSFNTNPAGRPMIIEQTGTLTEYFYPQLTEGAFDPASVTSCDSSVNATLSILTNGLAEMRIEGGHFVQASCNPVSLQPVGVFAEATVDPSGIAIIKPPHSGTLQIVNNRIFGTISTTGPNGHIALLIKFGT